jgi:hypothetical protein
MIYAFIHIYFSGDKIKEDGLGEEAGTNAVVIKE